MELDVLGQECGVADHRETETDADDEAHVEWIGQQADTRTRKVCVHIARHYYSTTIRSD